MVEARTEGELAEAVRSAYEPLLVLAGGSNVVVADDGLPGTVVRVLTRGVERDGARLDRAGRRAVGRRSSPTASRAGCRASSACRASPAPPARRRSRTSAPTARRSRRPSSRCACSTARAAGSRRCPPRSAGSRYRSSIFKYRDRHVVLAVTFALREDGRLGPAALRGAGAARSTCPVGGSAPLAEVREAVLGAAPRQGDGDRSRRPRLGQRRLVLHQPDPRAGRLRARCRRAPADRRPPAFPEPDGRIKTSAAWLIERAGFPRGYGDGPRRASPPSTRSRSSTAAARRRRS